MLLAELASRPAAQGAEVLACTRLLVSLAEEQLDKKCASKALNPNPPKPWKIDAAQPCRVWGLCRSTVVPYHEGCFYGGCSGAAATA